MTECGVVHDSVDILPRCAGMTPPDSPRVSTSIMDSGVATKQTSDFGGAARQEVIDVNGRSISGTASILSVLSCSVAENVPEGGAVDDFADILDRCARTTPLGSFRVSTFGSDALVITESSFYFGGATLQEVVVRNGLSISVTDRNLVELKCSIAGDVTEGVVVDDNADIFARCETTSTPGKPHATMVTEPSLNSGWTALQEVVAVNWLSTSVTAKSLSAPSCWVCVTEYGV